MNQDQTIALYESVADITRKMLAAARGGDWEGLRTLESDGARLIRLLQSVESDATGEHVENGVRLTDWTEAERLRKRTLIEQILADDREIRHLTESWMGELSSLINRDRVERQLSMAYGNHQTAS